MSDALFLSDPESIPLRGIALEGGPYDDAALAEMFDRAAGCHPLTGDSVQLTDDGVKVVYGRVHSFRWPIRFNGFLHGGSIRIGQTFINTKPISARHDTTKLALLSLAEFTVIWPVVIKGILWVPT